MELIMEKYMTIGKVAKELGVSICTLRRWDRSGKLKAAFRHKVIIDVIYP